MGQLEVQRQGGFQICKRLKHEWDAVVTLAGQAFEFKFGDHGDVFQCAAHWPSRFAAAVIRFNCPAGWRALTATKGPHAWEFQSGLRQGQAPRPDGSGWLRIRMDECWNIGLECIKPKLSLLGT